jgi:hypothetical protein
MAQTVLQVGQVAGTLWNAAATYAQYQLVTGSDGNTYQSIYAGTQIGHDPTTDVGTYWQLYAVHNSLSIDVTGTRFAATATGLSNALTFVKSAFVAGGATVTLSLAAATTYAMTSTTLALNITGGTLLLSGAGSASTVISFTTGALSAESQPGGVIKFSNLKLSGPGSGSTTGVTSSLRGTVWFNNCAIAGFYTALQLSNGAVAYFDGTNTITGYAGANVGLYQFGPSTTVSITGTFTVTTFTYGFLLTLSDAYCPSIAITSCTYGIYAQLGSRVYQAGTTYTSCTTNTTVVTGASVN